MSEQETTSIHSGHFNNHDDHFDQNVLHRTVSSFYSHLLESKEVETQTRSDNRKIKHFKVTAGSRWKRSAVVLLLHFLMFSLYFFTKVKSEANKWNQTNVEDMKSFLFQTCCVRTTIPFRRELSSSPGQESLYQKLNPFSPPPPTERGPSQHSSDRVAADIYFLKNVTSTNST